MAIMHGVYEIGSANRRGDSNVLTEAGSRCADVLKYCIRRAPDQMRSYVMAVIVAGVAVLASAPLARAEDEITYEVFSDIVPTVKGIEYRDVAGRTLLQDVPLPWRISVSVAEPMSARDGSELRADWRPDFRTGATVGRVLQGQWVTVRISLHGRVLCENTLDVGNVTCYGSVPHTSSPPNGLP